MNVATMKTMPVVDSGASTGVAMRSTSSVGVMSGCCTCTVTGFGVLSASGAAASRLALCGTAPDGDPGAGFGTARLGTVLLISRPKSPTSPDSRPTVRPRTVSTLSRMVSA